MVDERSNQYKFYSPHRQSNFFFIIGKLDIFPLMCAVDKVWITEVTLILKNIRSNWRKTHYDVTDKNNNISFEGLNRHIITNIPAGPIRLAEILVITYVSTFKITVIPYLLYYYLFFLSYKRKEILDALDDWGGLSEKLTYTNNW
jgi:hypothetical protein